jgi:hypothetical protein
MPWKTIQEDGGGWIRKWHRTRLANLLRLSGKPPKNLCIDQLNLTICCRYAETLLKNVRITQYLMKHHRRALRNLEKLLAEWNGE